MGSYSNASAQVSASNEGNSIRTASYYIVCFKFPMLFKETMRRKTIREEKSSILGQK